MCRPTNHSDRRGGLPLRSYGLIFAAALLLPLTQTSAGAQDSYPSKTIRIVVPYPPGAVTDSVTRPIAAELSKRLAQPVIVENKPGGGTLVGTQAVKYSPPDGYTLLFQADSLVTNLYTIKQPNYKLSDFKPVGMISGGAYVMVTSTSHPFRNLQDLIGYGREHPGELNYASTGPGSPASIIAAELGLAAKLEWTKIPFKGGAEATQAVMSRDVHAFVASQGAPLIHSGSDKMRMVAISSKKRSELLPDVPTFSELGYPTVVLESWNAFFVRSDTPEPIAAKLRATLEEIMASSAIKQQLKFMKLPPYEGTVDELPAKMEKQLVDFVEDARRLGIEPQ